MKLLISASGLFILLLIDGISVEAAASKRSDRDSSSAESEQTDENSYRSLLPQQGSIFSNRQSNNDDNIFITVPDRISSIIIEKRRQTSAVLQTASRVLSSVASSLLPRENSKYPSNTGGQPYVYQTVPTATNNPDQFSNSGVRQSSIGNRFPVIILSPSVNDQPSSVSSVTPVPISKIPTQNSNTNLFPMVQVSQSSHQQDSLPTTAGIVNGAEGQQAIPVATGGVTPPQGYNPPDQMIVLDNIPWLDRTENNNNNQPGSVFEVNQNNERESFPTINSGNNILTSANIPPAAGNHVNVYSVVDSIKEFTLDLVSVFRAMGQNGNVVYSPVSITSLLSLLTLATNGLTRHEIEVALNLPQSSSSNSQHRQYEEILGRLNHNSEGIIIKTSSRFFVMDTVQIYGSFTDKATAHYNCSVSHENFKSRPGQTQKRVNSWVENETQGKIKNFISSPFNPDTRLVAVNTIYFKGTWKTPFPTYFTAIRDFDTGSKVVRIPMMTNVFETPHAYSQFLNADIVSIPYAGDQFSMFVILPRESPRQKPIQVLESELDTFLIEEWIHNMTTKSVSLSLPKMRMAMKTSLVHSLAQLNIEQLFNPVRADFSGLTNEKIYVNEFLHEALLEFSELGTVAAAASAAVLDRFGGFQRVNINKSAIFFIRDLTTGVPLFWARLVEPEPLIDDFNTKF